MSTVAPDPGDISHIQGLLKVIGKSFKKKKKNYNTKTTLIVSLPGVPEWRVPVWRAALLLLGSEPPRSPLCYNRPQTSPIQGSCTAEGTQVQVGTRVFSKPNHTDGEGEGVDDLGLT